MKKNKGFTLVEIIIVVSIVGLLAGMGSYVIRRSMTNSRIKTAESELHIISSAILQMAWDTGKWPDGTLRTEPSGGVEDLSTCALMNSDASGDFSDWKGPYYEGSIKDPWGENYFFASDFDVGGESRIIVGSRGPSRGEQDDSVWVAVDNKLPESSED